MYKPSKGREWRVVTCAHCGRRFGTYADMIYCGNRCAGLAEIAAKVNGKQLNNSWRKPKTTATPSSVYTELKQWCDENL